MSDKVYVCNNDSCSLGSAVEPGRFTGGIDPESKSRITGDPVDGMTEGHDYGEGICPNCGKPGEPEVTEEEGDIV